MEYNDLVNLIIAHYKDKVRQEILENFLDESNRLLKADADSRRQKARENIMAMAKFNIELNKFKITYRQFANEYGEYGPIDEYIRQIEVMIKKLSYMKNRGC